MPARTAALALALFVSVGPLAARAAAESPKEKAARHLNDPGRAKAVILAAHLGATYVDHKLTGSGRVTANGRERPGHFYLEYAYDWKVGGDKGRTTLSFFFDAGGLLTGIHVDETTAAFNQPFLFADLGIKALGEAFKGGQTFKNMSAGQKKVVGDLIDRADAKGLLEFVLAVDLANSR